MPALIDDRTFSQQGYFAPTVYLRGDRYISNYNYYSSLQAATNKYFYLKNQGGANSTPIGMQAFQNNQQPQTLGINVDFYVLQGNAWLLASYSWIKANWGRLPPCVFSFVSTQGSGLYWAIFDPYYFGVSATTVKNVDPAKIAELDAFYREVQIMKYRYNAWVGFLAKMATRPLNVIEQRFFNEGMVIVTNLGNEMQTIRGLSLTYTQPGKIGNPVLLIIAIIAVLSAATAWTVTTIATERERTKRINDSYDLNKWVANKKQEIAQSVAAGNISQDSANSIFGTLDGATAVANKVAADAAKSNKGIFGEAADLLKWGVVGFLAYTFISKNKSA